MKNTISLLIMLILLLSSLSACNRDVIAIEDYEWKMRTVMSNSAEFVENENELVVAVGEPDKIHPNAKIIDIELVATNGIISINDNSNNKTYSGSYVVQQKTPKGFDYEITINGIKGFATVAPTEYYDGSEIPTLPINLGEYSLYFVPVKQ